MKASRLEHSSDEELASVASGARDGDAVYALEELLRRVSPLIYQLAVLQLHDKEVAMDAVQEVLFDIARGMQHFRGESKFRTWVYAIAKRKIWRLVKQQKRTEMSLASLQDEPQMESAATGQDELLITQEQQQILFAAMRSLPEKQREAVWLYYYCDFTLEEIAKVIGCLPSTVKAHLFKARQSLSHKLDSVFTELRR